jgi:hypothetical protein
MNGSETEKVRMKMREEEEREEERKEKEKEKKNEKRAVAEVETGKARMEVEAGGIEEKGGVEEGRRKKKAGRQLVVGDRDRQLLMALGEARVLSSKQLGELFFGGRAAEVRDGRLRGLERAGYTKRSVVRKLEGPLEVCWALGDAGCNLVESWSGVEPVDAGELQPEYLEHHLHVSELYVRLLGGSLGARLAQVARTGASQRNKEIRRIYARAEGRSWQWVATGSALTLPWREYAGADAKDRLIRPDALLEFPNKKVRVFVEGETGSQPIQSRNKSRLGATSAKLDRYFQYVTNLADAANRVSWYQQRFPDGFTPELLLLVPEGRRQRNVETAVQAWRAQGAARAKLSVVVATVDGAHQRYALAAGVQPPARRADAAAAPEAIANAHAAAPALGVAPAEALALKEFFASVRADLKRRQAEVVALQAQTPGKRLAMPVVPAAYDAMKALVGRLG